LEECSRQLQTGFSGKKQVFSLNLKTTDGFSANENKKTLSEKTGKEIFFSHLSKNNEKGLYFCMHY